MSQHAMKRLSQARNIALLYKILWLVGPNFVGHLCIWLPILKKPASRRLYYLCVDNQCVQLRTRA